MPEPAPPGTDTPETSSGDGGAARFFEALALPYLPALYRLAVRLTGRPQAGLPHLQQAIPPTSSRSAAASSTRICRWCTCRMPSSWNFEKQRLTVSSFSPR